MLLAAWALQREEPVRAAIAPFAIYFCFGAAAAAALLSWYHNFARMLGATATVALAVWSFIGLTNDPGIPRLIPALLLPVNVALFGWLTERGVLTTGGVMKLGIIGAQVAGVLFVAQSGDQPWPTLLLEDRPAVDWTWMPWSGLLSFWAAGLFLLFLAFRRRTKVEPALLWALVTVFVGLNQEAAELVFFYTGAAGLIVLLGVLEHGHDMAHLDELTRLPTRRAFNEALRLLRGRYSIAMCDADHFKRLNDTYGHDVGDQALRMIATRLSDVPSGGRVFRFGGEEFAILFRSRTAEEVQPILESLKETIAGVSFGLRGPDRDKRNRGRLPQLAPRKTITITISIGVADNSEGRSTPEMVLKAADAALYQAKEAGRNRVKLAEAPAAQAPA